MAERHREPRAFAARSSPVAAHHLRVGGGLVQEHEPVRVEIELTLEPRQALCLHVLPIPLGGLTGVFLRVMPWRWKKRDGLPPDPRGPSCQSVTQFMQEQLGLRLVDLSDQTGLCVHGV